MNDVREQLESEEASWMYICDRTGDEDAIDALNEVRSQLFYLSLFEGVLA